MKKKTLPQLKRKLDKIFSEFIRRRDADPNGYCHCITCQRRVYWKNGDAGHFQSRAKLSTRFDERNVNFQCKACNNWGSGRQYAHGKAIDFKHGEGTADKLENMPKDGYKISQSEYELLIEDYTKRVKIQRKVMGEN